MFCIVHHSSSRKKEKTTIAQQKKGTFLFEGDYRTENLLIILVSLVQEQSTREFRLSSKCISNNLIQRGEPSLFEQLIFK